MKRKMYGNVYICKGTTYYGDIDISGVLYVQKGATIHGSVNAAEVHMDEDSCIEGKRIWTDKLVMHRKASFDACLISEQIERYPETEEAEKPEE